MTQRSPRAFGVIDDYYINQISDLLDRKKALTELGFLSKDPAAPDVVEDFGLQFNYHIDNGRNFPLLSVHELNWKSIVAELIWFFQLDVDQEKLRLGNIDWSHTSQSYYSRKWRSWEGLECSDSGQPKIDIENRKPLVIDQLKRVIDNIKSNGEGEDLIVSSWDPVESVMFISPPRNLLFQFHVDHNGLSLHLYQSSADAFRELPMTAASYSLLLLVVAKMTGKVAHKFVHTVGRIHLSESFHARQGDLEKLVFDYMNMSVYGTDKIPSVTISDRIRGISDISEFSADDVVLSGYSPWSKIEFSMSI